MSDLRTDVMAVLIETGNAHHEAFKHVNGADENWPEWYGEYAFARLKLVLPGKFTPSDLKYAFTKADREYKTEKPEAKWYEFYADVVISEFTGS